jgi:hypothetical protein
LAIRNGSRKGVSVWPHGKSYWREIGGRALKGVQEDAIQGDASLDFGDPDFRAGVRVDFAIQHYFFKLRCGPSHDFGLLRYLIIFARISGALENK